MGIYHPDKVDKIAQGEGTITPEQQEQLDGLVEESIVSAFFEDFMWESKAQAAAGYDYLFGKLRTSLTSALEHWEWEE